MQASPDRAYCARVLHRSTSNASPQLRHLHCSGSMLGSPISSILILANPAIIRRLNEAPSARVSVEDAFWAAGVAQFRRVRRTFAIAPQARTAATSARSRGLRLRAAPRAPAQLLQCRRADGALDAPRAHARADGAAQRLQTHYS